MKCPKCNYEWEYKGTLWRIHCPNCTHQWVDRIRKEEGLKAFSK